MNQYRIAEMNIEIDTKSPTLIDYAKCYETSFDCMPNLRMSLSDDKLIMLMEEYEGFTADVIECEYMATVFSRSLFDFNGFPIRSVAVSRGDEAVLFASPFEEADLYELLPKEDVFCVDFPAVRLISSDFMVYDTPFGQRGNLSITGRHELKSIVFVDSERFSSLVRLEPKNFVALFMQAVTLNIRHERTKHTLFMLEKLMHKVSFFGVGKLDDAEFILERI